MRVINEQTVIFFIGFTVTNLMDAFRRLFGILSRYLTFFFMLTLSLVN